MANKHQVTTHLKQGKNYPDPMATAKATGTHFANNTSHNEITPTPDSELSAADGKLGGKNRP